MALTSKHKMAEAAFRIINGGHVSNDSNLRIQDLINLVALELGDILKMKYFEGRAEGERFLNGDFIYTFKAVTVSQDTDQDLYYCLTPAATVSLPYDMGTYQVSAPRGQNHSFIPVPNQFLGLYENLASRSLEGRFGYYIDGDRIYFVNMRPDNKVDSVMIKMAMPLGSKDEDETLNIPNDIEKEVVDRLVARFAPTKAIPPDAANDNV